MFKNLRNLSIEVNESNRDRSNVAFALLRLNALSDCEGGSSSGTGGSGAVNTGSGGSGGGVTSAGFNPGAGGGAGGYVEAIIASPSASYAYSIGTAGTAGSAGSSGAAGGSGGSGFLILEEYYQ